MRFYRTVSPLPDALRRRAVYSLLHFPSSHLDWPLASTLPCGARTFLDGRPKATAATACPARARSAAEYTAGTAGVTTRRAGAASRRGSLVEVARRGRVVLHDLLPVDDAVAGGAGLDRLAALQDVVELRRDVHVAALAGAVADADDRQAAAHADVAVALEDVRPHGGGQLVALDAQLGDLRLRSRPCAPWRRRRPSRSTPSAPRRRSRDRRAASSSRPPLRPASRSRPRARPAPRAAARSRAARPCTPSSSWPAPACAWHRRPAPRRRSSGPSARRSNARSRPGRCARCSTIPRPAPGHSPSLRASSESPAVSFLVPEFWRRVSEDPRVA